MITDDDKEIKFTENIIVILLDKFKEKCEKLGFLVGGSLEHYKKTYYAMFYGPFTVLSKVTS